MNAQFVLTKMMAWTTTFATPKVAATALRNTYIIHMKKGTNIKPMLLYLEFIAIVLITSNANKNSLKITRNNTTYLVDGPYIRP